MIESYTKQNITFKFGKNQVGCWQAGDAGNRVVEPPINNFYESGNVQSIFNML